MKRNRKYIEVEETEKYNSLCVEVFYTLGGRSMWTGENVVRGYYLSVTPCKRYGYGSGYEMVQTALGEGRKCLLKEVSRQSAKAEREAEEIALTVEQSVIYEVARVYGVTLKMEKSQTA